MRTENKQDIAILACPYFRFIKNQTFFGDKRKDVEHEDKEKVCSSISPGPSRGSSYPPLTAPVRAEISPEVLEAAFLENTQAVLARVTVPQGLGQLEFYYDEAQGVEPLIQFRIADLNRPISEIQGTGVFTAIEDILFSDDSIYDIVSFSIGAGGPTVNVQESLLDEDGNLNKAQAKELAILFFGQAIANLQDGASLSTVGDLVGYIIPVQVTIASKNNPDVIAEINNYAFRFIDTFYIIVEACYPNDAQLPETSKAADCVEIKAGIPFTLPGRDSEEFATFNYELTGWIDQDNNPYEPGTEVTVADKNITLYAQWEKRPTYSISYDMNYPADAEAASLGEEGGASVSFEPFTETISELPPERFFAYGYKFTGWKDGNGTDYQPGATIEVNTPNEPVNLYAQWQKLSEGNPAEYPTVTFNLPDGGDLGLEDGAKIKLGYEGTDVWIEVDANQIATGEIKLPVGTRIILPEPTKEGYDFLHWQGSIYYAGEVYTVQADHTLTAIWKKISSSAPLAADPQVDTSQAGTSQAASSQVATGQAKLVVTESEPTESVVLAPAGKQEEKSDVTSLQQAAVELPATSRASQASYSYAASFLAAFLSALKGKLLG